MALQRIGNDHGLLHDGENMYKNLVCPSHEVQIHFRSESFRAVYPVYIKARRRTGGSLVRNAANEPRRCTWLAMLCAMHRLETWRSESRARGAVLRRDEGCGRFGRPSHEKRRKKEGQGDIIK